MPFLRCPATADSDVAGPWRMLSRFAVTTPVSASGSVPAGASRRRWAHLVEGERRSWIVFAAGCDLFVSEDGGNAVFVDEESAELFDDSNLRRLESLPAGGFRFIAVHGTHDLLCAVLAAEPGEVAVPVGFREAAGVVHLDADRVLIQAYPVLPPTASGVPAYGVEGQKLGDRAVARDDEVG